METKGLITDLVVIGGSAGSLQVILTMVKNLNGDLNFPIVLILHRKAQAESILPRLLQQFSLIDVLEIEDKTEIKNNKIYIVPSDYHLLFEDKNTVSLDGSEKMNYSRPSIDVTFRSAAEIFGQSVVGVLLSGANSDGVEGLKYIKKNHGKVWIQDPETADVDYMPRQAVQNVEYDLIVKPDDLAKRINQLK
ncbi:chemotaxis protein CheB [Epilithonimonas lactis]|uniref:protein-glutamate methylesterase n=1 Tax=Epilithonimonas lactis TaxID=421072 RepID=A0A085BIL4_9FLAO|nr:chemotaxis protein CheB [Epilithonimonas lactis]KFC22309.1 chemotaxis protein CheB [Epilithonimonas lactis]SEQ61343.1 CheB methylesterase [Epilithonimonas lactis]